MLSALALFFAIPAVILSSEHQAMCRVAVGDAFPAVEGLADKQGAKATVVAVPGGTEWMNAMFTGDLKDDFAPKYADKGVQLVTLAGPPVGNGVASLSVDRAKLNATLGEGRGPRVYLLDADGKVVWFDIEYTLSTHRELHAALDELVAK
ncbi:hypothetical protein Pla108_02860 [Botrimarina colliarenosi]|uniref:AhpC/TSA family protein n=1 Tax=Botrimarina colliarenosi TaxID=2528001 RepID=A0A5C6AI90_9BACT|nr:hypothetical protein [Botrimarina colliarenosi]TWT99349.1 hypothetical protein Pla108_02860 [Botrimarina colliarenosi]